MIKKKILVVNTYYDSKKNLGGAARSIEYLINSIGDKYEIFILTLSSEDTFKKYKNHTHITFKNYYLFNLEKKTFLKKIIFHLCDIFNVYIFLKALILFRKSNFDIVFTNNLTGFSTSIIYAAHLSNLPVIHTLRDYYFLCIKSTLRDKEKNCIKQCFKCKLAKIVAKKSTQYIDHVISNSKYILTRHEESNYFINSKKSVIYNGYKLKNKYNKIPSRLSKEFHNIYGFYGDINEHKGIIDLCESFISFNFDYPETRLIIAGPSEKSFLLYLKKRYFFNFIIFEPPQSNDKFYPKIDWLVIPSLWHEPLSRTLFEIKFYSLPCIASNVGGTSEVLNDGFDGLIYNPFIKNDLLKSLYRSTTVNYQKFSANSNAGKEKFKIEITAEKYIAIFETANAT